MKLNKTTISIGIPAYNEEKNIINMLESVVKQKSESYVLEKIMVISDGSSDSTEKKVRNFGKKNRLVSLKADRKRLGKAERLNQLYRLNRSDFLGTFDADIVLERDCELELMMQVITSNKDLNVAAANQIPAKSKTLMGKFSRMSFFMFYEAAKKYRNGNNVHCLQGSSSIIRKKFAKTLKMPKGTSVDQGYLYAKSIEKNRNAFAFVKDTRIIFNPISTFKDWKVLGFRTLISDKENMAKLFGRKILKEYKIPKELIYQSMVKCFLINPFEASGAILMNMYIRKFPTGVNKAFHGAGIWEVVSSSKEAIGI